MLSIIKNYRRKILLLLLFQYSLLTDIQRQVTMQANALKRYIKTALYAKLNSFRSKSVTE